MNGNQPGRMRKAVSGGIPGTPRSPSRNRTLAGERGIDPASLIKLTPQNLLNGFILSQVLGRPGRGPRR